MTTPFAERSLVGTLRERLTKLMADQSAAISGGVATDFADYKARVGYLQAIRGVLEQMDVLAKDQTGR